ncbi:MAG: DUF456 domain-containing protein [Candidatus Nanohaloarchaea archaeon]
MELFTIIAVLLMIAAVVGSLVPALPGALLSIAGIVVYWYGTGYSSPGILFLTAFMATGLFAVLFDWFGGAIAAKAGGASSRTGIASGVAAMIAFIFLGPLGILIGVAGTVAVREYLRTGDTRSSLRAAAYSTAAVLSSAVVQFTITLALLASFIIALVF